jgi:hypothetical protein
VNNFDDYNENVLVGHRYTYVHPTRYAFLMADVLTKPLPRPTFERHRGTLGVVRTSRPSSVSICLSICDSFFYHVPR